MNPMWKTSLMECELVYISTDAFKNLLQLKVINLRFNFLTSLDANIFNGLNNLDTIHSDFESV